MPLLLHQLFQMLTAIVLDTFLATSAYTVYSSRHSSVHPRFAGLRVDDLARAGAVVADMRKIIRQDPRIIQKLHRRVFLDKITRDQVSIYISCYVEAPNRDAFMAVKQDLLLAFTDCVERNGARLARNRLQVSPTYSSCHLMVMDWQHACLLSLSSRNSFNEAVPLTALAVVSCCGLHL